MKWTKDPRKQWTRELEKFHFQKKGFTSWAWLAAAHFTCFQFHYQARQINSHTCLWLPFNLEPLICPLSQQIAILLAFHENTLSLSLASRDLSNRKWVLCLEIELEERNFANLGFSDGTDFCLNRSSSICVTQSLFRLSFGGKKDVNGRRKDEIEVKFACNVRFLAWMSRQCNETRR